MERKKKIEAERAAEDEREAAQSAADKSNLHPPAVSQAASAQPKDVAPAPEEDTKDFDELFGDSDSD